MKGCVGGKENAEKKDWEPLCQNIEGSRMAIFLKLTINGSSTFYATQLSI